MRLSRWCALCTCVLGAWCSEASAGPVGSYTFTHTGTAPAGTKVRITAKAKNAAGEEVTFDSRTTNPVSDLDISGLTAEQARNNLRDFVLDNFDRSDNGANSENVRGIYVGEFPNQEFYPITKVDTGTTTAGYGVTLGGTVEIDYLEFNAKYKVSFEPGAFDPGQGVTAGGDIRLAATGLGSLSATLSPGATAFDAATTLYELLVAASVPDVELLPSGLGVAFMHTPAGTLIGGIDEFTFTGANLHYGLELPATVPEPASLVLLMLGGLIVFSRRTGFRVA